VTRPKHPHGPTVTPRHQTLKVSKEVMERVLAVPWLAPKPIPSGSVVGMNRIFERSESN
jgi:hypothetical protein